MKIKKDKYFRKRGGIAKIIKVSCMNCGRLLFLYQKDGPGWLKRCYLNRIIYQEGDKEKELKNLICECGNLVGSPMKYKDGRTAFALIRGKFKRSLFKNQ